MGDWAGAAEAGGSVKAPPVDRTEAWLRTPPTEEMHGMNVASVAVRCSVIGALCLAGTQTANAWTYWMDYTGPSGGNWNTAANWSDMARNPGTMPTPEHHIPGYGGFDDFKAEVNGKTVYVTDDRSTPNVAPNALTYYRFYNGATIEIVAGGKLGGSTSEILDTAKINVRSGGAIVGGNWGSLNTFAGATISGVGNLLSGTSYLYGGTVAFTNVNGGSVVQDGATASASAYIMLGGGTSYQLKSGSLTANYVRPGMNGATQSTFTMTGGTLTANSWIGIVGVDGSDTGNGLMDVSGGTVTSNGAVGVGTNATGTGRLKITGSNATFNGGSLTVGSRGTLEYAFDSGGVTKVTVTGTGAATLAGGTLTLGLKAPVARFTATSFPLISYGKIASDFSTKNLGMFAGSYTGNATTPGTYTATLDPAKDMLGGGLLTIAAPQTFAAQNLGWLAIKSDDLAQGLFKLYLATSASGAGLNALVASINSAGYLASTASLGAYNLKVDLVTPTSGNRAYFAYDFATAGVNVSAAQLPEPAALTLLAMGGLLLPRRRRR